MKIIITSLTLISLMAGCGGGTINIGEEENPAQSQTNIEKPKTVQKDIEEIASIDLETIPSVLLVDEDFDIESLTIKDKDGNDISDKVVVTSNIDTDVPGEYKIVFSILDEEGNEVGKVVKKIIVKEKETVVRENTAPVLTLRGAAEYKVYSGEKYQDPGVVAIDKEDGDITKNIVVKIEKI